jgi:transcription elongation GreA/GreB family factor
MDKREIFEQIVGALQKGLAITVQARDTAQKEANSHVGKMESRYDTWKEENQYEVAAQELRILEYEDGINRIETLLANESVLEPSKKVRIGSIVTLESESGKENHYILSPAGGGTIASFGEVKIFTLTPDSPLGRQLFGLEKGDDCQLTLAGSKATYLVKEVL